MWQRNLHLITRLKSLSVYPSVPAGFIKDYRQKLLPALDSLGVKNLYVADSSHFKVLAD